MLSNPDAARNEILEIVTQPNYRPQKPRKFLIPLGLTPDDARPLRMLIREMIAQGQLAYGKGHLVLPVGDIRQAAAPQTKHIERRTQADTIIGRFQRRASGVGIVRPPTGDESIPGEIFIPAFWTSDAASGDTVAVRLVNRRSRDALSRKTNRGRSKKHDSDYEDDDARSPRGRIVEIIQRASNRFVGTYHVERGWGYVQVDGGIYKRTIPLGDAAAASAKPGDKIVVEMVQYPTNYSDGEAVIVEVLGAHGIPGLDTLLIMRQFDLPEHFSEAALDAAQKLAASFTENIVHGVVNVPTRLDLTGELVITIDPADAKDFDDAISLEKLDNGNWRLGVHIADVAHFVPKNSPIDKEAQTRATSIYLPDKVIPMLPEVLSNAIASLQPGKIRFAKSVFIEYTPDGMRTHTEIVRSAIKNKQRLNYTEVQDFFDHPEKYQTTWQPEVRKLLLNLLDFMHVLRRKRFVRGAIELTIPEPKIELNNNGSVVGAYIAPYDDSNRIVEECMLAANESVAELLSAKGISFLRRIHEGPTPVKMRAFTDFINSLNFAYHPAGNRKSGRRSQSRDSQGGDSGTMSRQSIQELLDSVRGTPQEYAVNFALLRSMQKAVYSPEDEGHYALASPCYCHFTSPIRRYPDLAVHRLLDEILSGKMPQSDSRELTLLAEHCSEREQRAESAERELIKLKLIDYLNRNPGCRMEAVITGVEPFGVFVLGLEIPAEGLIHLERLTDDFYRFERRAKILMGQRSGNVFRIGDRVFVQVIRADSETRQIDFRLVKRLKENKAGNNRIEMGTPC